MSLYFFLSHASVDEGPFIKRFFEDLSIAIRMRAGRHDSDPVGFYDETKYATNAEWTPKAADALRISHVMLPMISPAYFDDARVGKQWQVFEMRKESCIARARHKERFDSLLRSTITPLIWEQWEGSEPEVITAALRYRAFSHLAVGNVPILRMLKSMRELAGSYEEFVKALADHVIDTSESIELPQLTFVPKITQVNDAFLGTKRSQPRVVGDNAARAESIEAKQIIERGRVINLPPLDSSPSRNEVSNAFTSSTINAREHEEHAHGGKYSIWIIDDEPQLANILKETCLYSGLFEVKIYRDPLTALHDLELEFLRERQLPDLIVVDLVFDDCPMQGLQLIEELSQKKGLLAAILALSGNSDSPTLYEAVGAGANGALTKHGGDLLGQIKWWAKLGRNRRLHHEGKLKDPRKRQLVFLSYCSKDERIAKFLARNLDFRGIAVWYGPDSLEPGDDWREKIQDAFVSARVFIPLITRNYANSPHCRGELNNIIYRFKSDPKQPLLLTPVLHDSSASELEDELIGQCLNYHWVTMPPARFIDGFAALFQRIQNFLDRNP